MLQQTSPLPVSARPKALATWLFAVAFLVILMVAVGGITRLTESGLSITEWKPVTGAIPPVGDAQWQAEFAKYQAIPEYQVLNQGMTLAQFKTIYFWEYVHRLLGRLIGLAFAVPLAWFAIRRAIPRGYGVRLVALLALGGLQGAVGWWMVTSGLAERTDVSHFRLAVHLLTALAILAGLVWTALDLVALARNPRARPARMTRLTAIVGIVLFVQLLFGAFVAGLDAGHVTREWPLMNGSVFPPGVIAERGVVDVVVNDPFVLHWIHRWWAFVAVGALVVLARRVRQAGARTASVAIHSLFGVQILLGIATVMTGVALPLAIAHQVVAALLVTATAWGAHVVGQQTPGSTSA